MRKLGLFAVLLCGLTQSACVPELAVRSGADADETADASADDARTGGLLRPRDGGAGLSPDAQADAGMLGREDAASLGDARRTPPSTDGSTGCPHQTVLQFDTLTAGDTSAAGWAPVLSSWFAQSDVACLPATQSASYPAAYQVYSLLMPSNSDWDLVVTPAAKVDVSVVAWQESALDSTCAPLTGAGVVSCEARNSGGAGSTETMRLTATTSTYRVFVLVATPRGAQPGPYSLLARRH